jgi:hypothetical protein
LDASRPQMTYLSKLIHLLSKLNISILNTTLLLNLDFTAPPL